MKTLIKEYQDKKQKELRIEAMIEIWQKFQDISDLQAINEITDKEVEELKLLEGGDIHTLKERNYVTGNFSVKNAAQNQTALNIDMTK